jgi:hypothetical protein
MANEVEAFANAVANMDMDVWSEIQNDDLGVTPEGNASDFGVADIEAYSRLKGARGREVVDLTVPLLIAQGRLCRRRMAN